MLRIKEPVSGYKWLDCIKRPDRYLKGFMELDQIMQIDCVIAGSKFIDFGRDQIWGRMPDFSITNRTIRIMPHLTFLYDRTGVLDRARLDPDIYYYWERTPEDGKPQYIDPPTPTNIGGRAGRPTKEAHNNWNELDIAKSIEKICTSIVSGTPVDEACYQLGISHYTFVELFQSRYPGEYYEWKTYSKIPQTDNLTKTLVKRFPSMSSTCWSY